MANIVSANELQQLAAMVESQARLLAMLVGTNMADNMLFIRLRRLGIRLSPNVRNYLQRAINMDPVDAEFNQLKRLHQL